MLLTRPGPVNAALDQAFKQSLVEKEYLAVVRGGRDLPPEGQISARLGPSQQKRDKVRVVERGGRRAETHYQVFGRADGLLLLKLRPKTGRMHQLRVHLAHIGVPVMGDRIYGGGEREGKRLMLHALGIGLPEMNEFPARVFNAPAGEDFLSLLPSQLQGLCS